MEMDGEEREREVIEKFVKRGSDLKGSSLVNLIIEATSHSSVFTFSKILALPGVLELQGTEYSKYIDLLHLFAHGTWRDYKRLVPDQVLKLKQLSVLSLAEQNKVLSYYQLMQELEISNVRELEDFLINECIYAGIAKGKLNQLQRCFTVQFAAGRDLKPGELGRLMQTLTNWMSTSDKMLWLIEEKINWADMMEELDLKHQEEVEDRMKEAKKCLVTSKDVNKLVPVDNIDMLCLAGELSMRKRRRTR